MAMLVTDPHQDDNPIVAVNQAFLDLTGYERRDVLGRNCRFLQGPDTDQATRQRIREALGQGEGIEVEILNYRKDGSAFWNELVISPIRDETGAVLRFFGSQFDVSEKKQSEFELQRARDHLEEEVRRRTRDLQGALDQKSVLLHEVDHRVKNNLQVVLSLLLLQARRSDNPAVKAVLQTMAERISALSTVHRLLYPADDVRRFDVGAFVSQLARELTEVGTAGPTQLRLEVEPVAVSAGKASPLALLINELISNAVRHGLPDDPGALAVRIARSGGALEIAIEDGAGLPETAAGAESFATVLINLLLRQLRGQISYERVTGGKRATIVIPLDPEETPC